jgi:hypothetical protein
MSQKLRHWPGGIPPQIRPHHRGDLCTDEIKEEVKGWLLFVKVGSNIDNKGIPRLDAYLVPGELGSA